ncbi:MAG: YebC/PmpR family DNA-binding transcriptional regulator [Chloroflexi bacterium]|nr:YebC/PmpR family DNA-binding transcriptional regulator [Chloroflexota bacterium]
MSGHSKWAQIKRQKGVNDARRGQVFTKLIREIAVAARNGGPDPESNFRLRLAVQKAREQNMPMENVERAIKRGGAGPDAAALEEIAYEGYGPKGAAFLVQVLTDNRNRAVAEVRNAFTRHGGSLGETGCVAWIFEPKGILNVEVGDADGEEVALLAIDAGADDVKISDGSLEIFTPSTSLEEIRKTMEDRKLEISLAEIAMVPKTTIPLEGKDALQTLRLLDRLESLDDVQKVFFNADIPEETMEEFGG